MSVSTILNEIKFVERYKKICEMHNDFESSMRGSNKKEYENILIRLGYNAKYQKNGNFFNVHDSVVDVSLNLVLKDGLVEALLFPKVAGELKEPCGRLDGIADSLSPSFSQEWNIPKYASYEELEEILKGIFAIYEDFKAVSNRLMLADMSSFRLDKN